MLSERYTEAVTYASVVHGGQRRKRTEIPYLSHLLSVSALVLEDGGDEDEAIAGLLDDSVEDAGGQDRLEDVRLRFGGRVADIVKGCTDAYTDPKPPWSDRKRAYLESLESEDTDVLRVSAADKLHNARAILADYHLVGREVFERFKPWACETLGYYQALARVYSRRLPESSMVSRELNASVQALLRETRITPLPKEHWTCRK